MSSIRYKSVGQNRRISVVPENPQSTYLDDPRRRRSSKRTGHDLPPDIRKIVEAHFFEGEAISKSQRRNK
jgi:hypothetical protein